MQPQKLGTNVTILILVIWEVEIEDHGLRPTQVEKTLVWWCVPVIPWQEA
jgi:hypothetical protein